MSVMVINSENFTSEVLHSEKPVLIDFWASWCGPCRMMSPVVDKIAEAHPEVKVGKVNVDDVPELAVRYGVESIPTLLVFRGGQVVQSAVGVQPESTVEAMLK